MKRIITLALSVIMVLSCVLALSSCAANPKGKTYTISNIKLEWAKDTSDEKKKEVAKTVSELLNDDSITEKNLLDKYADFLMEQAEKTSSLTDLVFSDDGKTVKVGGVEYNYTAEKGTVTLRGKVLDTEVMSLESKFGKLVKETKIDDLIHITTYKKK